MFDQDAPGLGGVGAGHQFGLGLAVGHFTSTRYADVAVSDEGQRVSGHANACAVVILRGSRAGLTANGAQLLTAPAAAAGHYFGGGLATVHVDGAAADVLAVAAPLAPAGATVRSGDVRLFAADHGRLQPTSTRYVLRDFPGTADQTDVGMGAFVFAPPKSPLYPAVNSMLG